MINNSTFSKVSWERNNEDVQRLIDDSFEVRVKPLHALMFNGTVCNYIDVGSKEYGFESDPLTARGDRIEDFVQKLAKEHFSILDLGTGNGAFLQSLKDKYEDRVSVLGVTAADFRPTHYNKTSEKDKEGNAVPKWKYAIPDEEYVVGNMENLSKIPSLQGRKFDLIVSQTTYRHLSDPIGVICQAYEYLNPGGYLVADDFKLNGISGEEYAEAFSKYEVKVWPLPHKTYGYMSDFTRVVQTVIKKTEEHLDLPILYDVESSTEAGENHQAQIHYKIVSDF